MLNTAKPIADRPVDPPYGSDAHIAQLRAVRRDVYGRCAPYTAEALRLQKVIAEATTEHEVERLIIECTIFNRLLDSGEVTSLREACFVKIGDLRRAAQIAAGDKTAAAIQRAIDRIRAECSDVTASLQPRA